MKQKRFFLQILSLSLILFGLFAGVIIVSNKDAVLKRSSAAGCAGLGESCVSKICCWGLLYRYTGRKCVCICPSSCKKGCVINGEAYECRTCTFQGEKCKSSAECCSSLKCLFEEGSYICDAYIGDIPPSTPTPTPVCIPCSTNDCHNGATTQVCYPDGHAWSGCYELCTLSQLGQKRDCPDDSGKYEKCINFIGGDSVLNQCSKIRRWSQCWDKPSPAPEATSTPKPTATPVVGCSPACKSGQTCVSGKCVQTPV